MSDTVVEEKTGLDLWTPNDYSNFITICAAAIGSTLLVIFKSRCKKISLCCGLWSCDRELADDDDDEPPVQGPPVPPVPDGEVPAPSSGPPAAP